MKGALLACIALFLAVQTNAQKIDENYTWDDTLKIAKYDSLVRHDEEATIIFDKTLVYYEELNNNRFNVSRWEHRLLWIEKSSAIDKINEIWLPSNAFGFKARIVKENGDRIDFDISKIETLTTDGGSRTYQKLALQGVQEKCWVEILYKLTDESRVMRIFPEDRFYSVSSVFVIQRPSTVNVTNVSIAGFNGFVKNDSLSNRKTTYFESKNQPKWIEEGYSHEYYNAPRVDLIIGATDWLDLSSIVINSIAPTMNRINGRKAAKTFLRKNDIIGANDLETLINIERFLKEEITYTESQELGYSYDVRLILKKRLATDEGKLCAFIGLFEAAEIPFEFFILTEKDYLGLNEDFASGIGLSDFAFYFPKQDIYIAPLSDIHRLGRLPSYMTGIKALKLRPEYVNAFDQRANGWTHESEWPILVDFPKTDVDYNGDGTFAHVTFNDEAETCEAKITKKYVGYRAIDYRGYLFFVAPEEKEALLKDFVASGFESPEISPISVTNDDVALSIMCTDTLFMSATLTADEMVENIPNGYLINVPKVIGKQTSFYEETARQKDIFIGETKKYFHTIVFDVPEGYTAKNYENFNFDVQFIPATDEKTDEDEIVAPAASFKSEARMEGNQLILEVNEFYMEGFYDKSGIDEFKKVVNAAYEFYITKLALIEG